MWTIRQIFDGDYGCEELAPGQKPRVSVTLVNESGEEKRVSVEDERLTRQGLDVGSVWKECIVPAPLYRDPIYDAPTDPVVIWNHKEKQWWMLYTQRRSAVNSIGVCHIHGTAIGVASSTDGIRWLYRGTLPGLDFEPGHNTFWAPEIIYAEGKYHMYVSYITGVPTDWNWPRHIVHYTADDLWQWHFESVLKLSSERVIDACVHPIGNSQYKMWYKDEENHSYTYSAISSDLYHWEVCGKEIDYNSHEGPNVFELGGKKWMITDEWNGLGVYETEDYTHWKRQGYILRDGGSRNCDGVMASHADVVSKGDVAYIFYFTHPYFTNEHRLDKSYVADAEDGRACIQVALLEVKDGKLTCDRNQEFEMRL